MMHFFPFTYKMNNQVIVTLNNYTWSKLGTIQKVVLT